MTIRLTVASAVTAPRRRGVLLAVLASVVLLLLAVSSLVLRSGPHGQRPHAPVPSRTAGPPAASKSTLPTAGSDPAGVARDLQQLAAVPDVPAATSRLHPPIPGSVRAQPDLYAAAFVSELLGVDYRTSRDSLLAWVQSEAAQTSEPLVIGLVPPALRPKFALWSVIDAPPGDATPIPGTGQWAALAAQSARTTVVVQSVTEPPSWTQAIADGRITDPGVAARDVDATVTTDRVVHGRLVVSRANVLISLTLEGPPRRAGYGFVDALTYSAVPIGG